MTRIIIYESKAVYVDGYKDIICYDEHLIILKCHNQMLKIEGQNLSIFCYSGLEMKITGTIVSMAWIKNTEI
ncbi:MAG: YabP/YqfC family sporulation protein [Eubacteriales bacterium]|nr:YabP/YqfC family sporulation protein [Lachnospiraceae bacterium]MDO5127204.1 YabP/YqfC family sporulation protein [Eubacteriales bacterium]